MSQNRHFVFQSVTYNPPKKSKIALFHAKQPEAKFIRLQRHLVFLKAYTIQVQLADKKSGVVYLGWVDIGTKAQDLQSNLSMRNRGLIVY
jgi:hypothetical protein